MKTLKVTRQIMEHSARTLKSFVLPLTAAFILSALVFGCGGGGGGGDGAAAGINYTGLTTRALIDANNAERLALGVYAGGDISADFIMIGAAQNNEPAINSFNVLSFSRQLMDVMLNVDFDSPSYDTYAGAIKTDSQTIYGACGGNYKMDLSVNDQTGDFDGTIKFNNYCENDVTINGPAAFTGKINLNTFDFSNFIISFNNVSSSNGVETVVLKGNMALLFDDVPPLSSTATINSLIEYSSTGKVFKLQNYQMVITEGNDGGGWFVQVVLTGKYFDPDYGYVDFTSSTPLKIYDADMFPSEGIIILDGANGVGGGSTKARFTALNDTSYVVEADTTGDGVYDYNSGATNW